MTNTNNKSTQNKIAKLIIFTICVLLTNNLFAQGKDTSLRYLNSTRNNFNRSINMCPVESFLEYIQLTLNIYSVNHTDWLSGLIMNQFLNLFLVKKLMRTDMLLF